MVEVECTTSNCKRRRDNGSNHCERMLQSQQQSQEDGNFVIEAVEWSFVVFVFAIQRPDIRGDEVQVVLDLLSLSVQSKLELASYIVTNPSFPACEVMHQILPRILSRLRYFTRRRRCILNILLIPKLLSTSRRLHLANLSALREKNVNSNSPQNCFTNNLNPNIAETPVFYIHSFQFPSGKIQLDNPNLQIFWVWISKSGR